MYRFRQRLIAWWQKEVSSLLSTASLKSESRMKIDYILPHSIKIKPTLSFHGFHHSFFYFFFNHTSTQGAKSSILVWILFMNKSSVQIETGFSPICKGTIFAYIFKMCVDRIWNIFTLIFIYICVHITKKDTNILNYKPFMTSFHHHLSLSLPLIHNLWCAWA